MKKAMAIALLLISGLSLLSCSDKEDEQKKGEFSWPPKEYWVYFSPTSCDIVPVEGDTIDIQISRLAALWRLRTTFTDNYQVVSEVNPDTLASLRSKYNDPDFDRTKLEQELESRFLKVHAYDVDKVKIIVYPLDTTVRAMHAIQFEGGTFYVKQNSAEDKWE